MTIPYLMNCPHDGDGWCLGCVKRLGEECEAARDILRRFVDIYGRHSFDPKELRQESIPFPSEDYAELFFEVLMPAMDLLGLATPERDPEGRGAGRG